MLTHDADITHSLFPPPAPPSVDSGNDDLARGEGNPMGEGEEVEEKDSDRLLGAGVGDLVRDPKVSIIC